MGISHQKILAGPSNGNPNQVQPGDWNAAHALTGMLALLDALSGQANKVMTFDGSGNPELLPKSSILTAVSPALTGTPTAPTASLANNSDQIATTAFVQGKIAALIASAPGLLDTLDEIAAALGDDPNFAATMTTLLALKAPLASPVLIGNPQTPDQVALSNNSRIANTKYVDLADAAARAALQALNATPANPTGTTDATGKMMGLGLTTCRFTPTTSRVDVSFDGHCLNSTAGAVGTLSFRYGQAAAGPANGANLTGTVVGGTPNFGNGTQTFQPLFSLRRIITGLTPGQPYWFDLSLNASGGTSSVSSVNFAIRDF